MAKPTPVTSLRVSRYLIPAYERLPNTSVHNRPLLVYHSVFGDGTGASASAPAIEKHLKSVGAVIPQWRYSMYTTTHYHSTSHELLCIFRGKAKLCFGGEDNPGRVELVASEGDVILVPAGVAHRLLKDINGGFEMVGSYPPGKQWDMCYGRPDEADMTDAIRRLKWFELDPVYGNDGPAMKSGEEDLQSTNQ